MSSIGDRDLEGVDSWYSCEVHSRIYFSPSDVQYSDDQVDSVEILQ